MAAPAAAEKLSYRFRDAKGNTGRMTFIIGDATEAAVMADYDAGVALLQACTNANVQEVTSPNPVRTYGTNAEFPNIEDKAVLVFSDSQSKRHTFQLPAPKLNIFEADGETVKQTGGSLPALLTWIETFVFGFQTDTAALGYLGGFRLRRKNHRKVNINVLSSNLDEPND
jgi:hypothetical protein